MAITFHCEHCGKKINAGDSNAGKWAKCPSCHNKVYIPDLTSGEELKLAPINPEDDEKQKKLMAETYKLRQEILLEKETPNSPASPSASISDKELTKNIILYLRQMADGQLEDAQITSKTIKPCGRRALEVLDRIAISEMPEPELADVPNQVLAGLIRSLRTEIS